LPEVQEHNNERKYYKFTVSDSGEKVVAEMLPTMATLYSLQTLVPAVVTILAWLT
jgi:hypothetical protein